MAGTAPQRRLSHQELCVLEWCPPLPHSQQQKAAPVLEHLRKGHPSLRHLTAGPASVSSHELQHASQYQEPL